MTKPLVSLTVICYNAENFIEEAIEGALSQTYSPLEIIFSDDNSPDRTFEIIQEKLKNYQGPHKIVLNQNPKNLGIGSHISKVWFNIAKGDWIIVSAGDDISLPDRVEKLMEFANEDVGLIHHNCFFINEKSEEISDRNKTDYSKCIEVFEKNDIEETIRTGMFVKGATMCINKKVLDTFGTFNADVVQEDKILAYRAQYLGKIIHLDDCLMKYRMHSKSSSYQHDATQFKWYVKIKQDQANKFIAVHKQILTDNKILKLSNTLLKELEFRKRGFEMDLFLYSDHQFKLNYLLDKRFFRKLIARLFINQRLMLKRKRQNQR